MDHDLKIIPVSKLLVNPNNARIYNKDTDSKDEIEGIIDLIKHNKNHVLNLCADIAENGLMPNQLPVVKPIEGNSKHLMVQDGNRRLTSIKLMTQYRDSLRQFNLTEADQNKIKSLTTAIEKVLCVVSHSKSDIDKMLFRSHVAGEGIGQLPWRLLSKDKHIRNSTDKATEVYAFVRLLAYLNEYSNEITSLIDRGRVDRKLDAFATNKSFMLILGLEFDGSKNIKCYYDKSDLKRIVTNLFIDVRNHTASQIIQPKIRQQEYIDRFINENGIAQIKIANRVQVFSPYVDEFIPELSADTIPKAKIKELVSQYTKNITPEQSTAQNETIPSVNTTTADCNLKPNSSMMTPKVEEQMQETAIPAKTSAQPTTSNEKTNSGKKATDDPLPPFFALLRRSAVDTQDPKNHSLIIVCDEIVSISKNTIRNTPIYASYPISATVLFRVFVEQTLKYFLRKTMPNEFNRLKNASKVGDPELGIISKQVQNNHQKLFPDTVIQNYYTALFKESFINTLNLTAHHSRKISTEELDSYAQQFLHIANYILNTKLKNIEKTTNP